jgi:hypothetical protein
VSAPAIVGPWQHDDDEYSTQYAETSDPRILAVIQRDDMADAPDGDADAPAFWIEYRSAYTVSPAGHTWQDDDAENIAERYADALERFAYRVTHRPNSDTNPGYLLPRYEYAPRRVQQTDILARWLRIFHGTQVVEIDRRGASYGVDGRVLIFDTPGYRADMGTPALGTDPALDAAYLDGDRATWAAYMEGDVFGVGYATMPTRTTNETPVSLRDVTPDGDTWDIQIECWGHYGETYARETAAGFEYGTPNLPAMLDGTAPEGVAA